MATRSPFAVLALAAGVLLEGQTWSQEPSPERALDAAVEALREAHGVPALAGVLVDAGGQVRTGGVAGTTVAGGDRAVDPTSRWHLGSCTKAMTATLAAIDVEAGRITWDASPVDVLGGGSDAKGDGDADWAPHASWAEVTLAQLLSHTAGAPTHDELPIAWLAAAAHPGPPEVARGELVHTILARPLESEPGSTYRYSNLGYVVAGAMLEAVGEGSYEERLQRDLFAPLGITSAGFGPPPAESDPEGHRLLEGASTPIGRDARADNPPAIAPAGTVHMTLADWGRFVGLHLRRGRGERELLAPESFDALWKPRRDDYALGWMAVRRAWSEGVVLHHAGSNTYWFATVWAAPNEGFAALACTNSASEAAMAAADALVGRLIAARGEER
ncbi:MAG: serine hydrolase domain-containing protein [Planctomycetota bacterium]